MTGRLLAELQRDTAWAEALGLRLRFLSVVANSEAARAELIVLLSGQTEESVRHLVEDLCVVGRGEVVAVGRQLDEIFAAAASHRAVHAARLGNRLTYYLRRLLDGDGLPRGAEPNVRRDIDHALADRGMPQEVVDTAHEIRAVLAGADGRGRQ